MCISLFLLQTAKRIEDALFEVISKVQDDLMRSSRTSCYA